MRFCLAISLLKNVLSSFPSSFFNFFQQKFESKVQLENFSSVHNFFNRVVQINIGWLEIDSFERVAYG